MDNKVILSLDEQGEKLRDRNLTAVAKNANRQGQFFIKL